MSKFKEAVRHLAQVFTDSTPSTFENLDFPVELDAFIDNQLSVFASLVSQAGPSQGSSSEAEKEQLIWREALLEIWKNSVEPAVGHEGEPLATARVSAFLLLLAKTSSAVKEDYSSAIVSAQDLETVWWPTVLKRVLLGQGKLQNNSEKEKDTHVRGRRGTPRWMAGSGAKGAVTNITSVTSDSAQETPLASSRSAINATIEMITWAMKSGLETKSALSNLGSIIWEEYKETASKIFAGKLVERFGVANLEACILSWGEAAPETFFNTVLSRLSDTQSILPFLSILLSYLAKYSSKTYHCLKTALPSKLTSLALTTTSPIILTVINKCLAILLISLPILLGKEIIIKCILILGRCITWEATEATVERLEILEADTQNIPFETHPFGQEYPDTRLLFTSLYGMYPLNLLAFIKNPMTYLSKFIWSDGLTDTQEAPSEKNEIPFLDPEIIAKIDFSSLLEKSQHLIHHHTLTMSLLHPTETTESELKDTTKWRNLEAGDVMAKCCRHLVMDPLEFRDPGSWLWDDAMGFQIHPDLPESKQNKPLGLGLQTNTGDDLLSSIKSPLSPIPQEPPSNSRSRSRSRSYVNHYADFKAMSSRSVSRNQGRNPASPTVDFGPYTMSPPEHSSPISPVDSLSRLLPHSRLSNRVSNPMMETISITPFINREISEHSHQASQESSRSEIEKESARQKQLELEVLMLRGEVKFQNYLKALHVAHMGTLHREKVLQSGAEAERQSLYRMIRTLRSQLQHLESSLTKTRQEAASSKTNWSLHIEELRTRNKTLREARTGWDKLKDRLEAQIEDLVSMNDKLNSQLAEANAKNLDLENQALLDAQKITRIDEYETRISHLVKALSVCDQDLAKFALQSRELNDMTSKWKAEELLRLAAEKQIEELKSTVQILETELATIENSPAPDILLPGTDKMDALQSTRDELERLREEVEQLRESSLTSEQSG